MASVVSWQNVTPAAAVTAGAGSNRVVAITCAGRAFAAGRTVTALSYGAATIANGKIKTAAGPAEFNDSTNTRYLGYVFYILEADIPAGANTLSDATWSGTMDGTGAQLGFVTLQDVDQTTPVEAVASAFGSALDPISGQIVAGADTAQVMVAYSNHGSGTATIYGAGWTEQLDTGSTQGAGHGQIMSGSAVTTTGKTLDFGVDYPAITRNGMALAVSFAPAATAAVDPSITTVSALTDGAAFTITGSDFGASTGTLLIGGVAHATTTWGNTSITGTLALGTRMLGTNGVVVTHANGHSSGTFLADIAPAATEKYVDLDLVANLYPTENRVNFTSEPPPEGVQFRYRNPTNATLANVSISPKGDISADPTVNNTNVTIDVAANDGTGWSLFRTMTLTTGLVAPVFTPSIANVSKNVGDSPTVIQASSSFTGASSYSIAPAIPAHWSFDAASGRLTIPATVAGSFGSFTITATNPVSSTASNSFTVTVTAPSVKPRPRRRRSAG